MTSIRVTCDVIGHVIIRLPIDMTSFVRKREAKEHFTSI